MIELQPILENDEVILYPLQESDFEAVYKVASDPKVWEQHPNKDRYKREVFAIFFRGAIESGGAFKIVEKKSGDIIGCTRYYGFKEDEKSIHIGYTFYGVKFWGSKFNPQVKTMMMDYIFRFVDKIHFHVGKYNIRSRNAMERLGAVVIDEIEVAYYGESPQVNVVYEIKKPD